MAEKIIEKNGHDIIAKTYFVDMIKHIKFTNEVDFQQEWSSKKGKYRIEVYIDKHHHKITLRVNGQCVCQAVVEGDTDVDGNDRKSD